MTMSTQTLREAARMLKVNVLRDTVQVCNLGEPVTTGIHVARLVTTVGQPLPGLVQTLSPEAVAESRTNSTFSVKVPAGTALAAGQAVRVLSCLAEPELVGKVLLIDNISRNGLAMIRKGYASDSQAVNTEGKAGL